MDYKIFENGEHINTIFADEAFVKEFCAAYGYTFEAVPEPEPTLIPSELREKAYNTERVIEWAGKTLTVTEAATQWQYYAAEGNEKAAELKVLIASAKAEIRAQYPNADENEVVTT